MAEWLEKIVEALREGATVLTVNRRLSKHIQSAYNSVQQSTGKCAWETPVVLPVGAWSERLWREARSANGRSGFKKPVSLISEARSRALWMSIVESGCTASARKVLYAQGVAETSYSAYKLMAEYCVTIEGLGPELYLSVESKAFKGWVSAYAGRLAALGFIDKSMLKSRVVEAVKECGKVDGALPDSIFLAGFETLTPSVRLLMSTLRSAGVKVENIGADKMTLSPEERAHKEKVSGPIVVRQFADEVEEVRAGARWVRARLAENREGNGGTIGVVVPDLQRYRATLLSEFSAELDPKSVLPWEESSGVFNVSLGAPLADAPLVRSALALLSIHGPGDTVESLASVLFSPAFSYDRETYAAAALLDAELRRDRVGVLSLVGLKRAMETRVSKGGVLAGAVKKLGYWIETLCETDSVQLPGYWADTFATLLDALGWPVGGTVLSSAEYQLVEAWRSMLGDFSAFDDTLGPVSRSEACGHLKRLAAGVIHQVESPDSPVQVLGLFEAAGFTFDSLLLLGADSTALPASRTPNPFIPLEVQKELGFQDSTPERVHRFAAAVAARVLKSGVRVEVSYARTFGGVEQSVSPLLPVDECTFVDVEEEALKKLAEGGSVQGSSIKERLHAAGGASVLEELLDVELVALTDVERANLKGGTSIIKDQSACPFKAFATHRLGARGISVVEPGFDSMDRGNTVHEALKHFWREVKDSATLAEAASEGTISVLVSVAVAKAMDGKGRELPAGYLKLEAERVEALLTEWLELELKRESFTVKATECSEEITVGGLKLKTRLDRIDTLRSGGELIIDYKTGECKREYWNPKRPKEPQLLLYNLVGSFDAIAFARVKLKGTKFIGVMKETVELPGVKPVGADGWTEKIEGVDSWEDLETLWKETLEAIAEEFAGGVARVAPDSTLKGNDHPCAFCDLTLLCRRYELNVGPGRRKQ
jgi:probable DNA repair protein